jgi:hypothetical protein
LELFFPELPVFFPELEPELLELLELEPLFFPELPLFFPELEPEPPLPPLPPLPLFFPELDMDISGSSQM